jgi:tight adherence protein C
MTAWNSVFSMLVFIAVFGVINVIGLIVYLRVYRDRRRAVNRLRALAEDKPPAVEEAGFGDLLRTALTKLGAYLFPDKEHANAPLRAKLLQAGYYRPNTAGVFLGVKLALMVILPLFTAAIPYALGGLSLHRALLASLIGATGGMVLPGVWLDMQVRKRQQALRQALPDALDMLVLCLESGASMVWAFQRVAGEVHHVHPLLGGEMSIMQREMQLGLSVADALKKFGERSGLEDVRDMASVLLQSERYGASAVKALRSYAETWRQERQQRAEESAQKASVKILFPTLLCIFPAIFVVLLGPAALQMAALFSK